MPWMLQGNCVHKENADGSAGELVKCHENHDEAVAHMQALYAAMEGESKTDGVLIGTVDGTPVYDATGDEELIFFGSPIKDLGAGKIGGYLVRYTTDQDPDLTGDFFDAKTQITVPDGMPVFYNHGLDKKMQRRVIGKAKTGTDDTGLWVEAQMNMRDEYEKAIYHMALQGKLGWSSGALSHLVDREPAGKAMHIKTWVIGEASLTPTPAEYRNTVTTLKSLEASEAALSDVDVKAEPKPNKERHMDENEVKAVADAAVAKALAERDEAQKAEAQKAADLKAAEEAGYKAAVEDLRARKPVKYHTTEKVVESDEGAGAFRHWMKTGQENHELIEPSSEFLKGDAGNAKAAYNYTTGASGGFLVPDPLFNQIIAKRDLASWVRQLPVQMFQTEADHILVPYENSTQAAMTLTAEAAAFTEAETTVGQRNLILYKYTNETRANDEFLMYNSVNFDSWFANLLGRVVATTENTIFTTGVGTTAPEGVVTGATVANTTATTDVILPDEFTAFLGYLGDGYNVASECGLLMNNTTLYYLLGITSAGHPLFPSSFSLTPNGEKRLMGYKVVVDDDVVVYTTASAKCIVFGNFNYYGVVEKPGIVVQRNPYLYMANGQVGIFSSIYRGGGVLQGEAFYYLTNHS